MTRKRAGILVGAILTIASALGAAQAGQDAFMRTGARTTQPVGHYEFCLREPAECRQVSAKQGPVTLTRDLWARLIQVNNDVNVAVNPRTDMEMWGIEEFWSYPVAGQGDCEDYVLEKRRRLIAMGIPVGNLLITVVRQRNGEGHAVLTVRTSLGDYILDNLEPRVLAWKDTDYTYLKRQSERRSGTWLKIEDGRADAVASVR